MFRDKKHLLEYFELLYGQITGTGVETFTEQGVKDVLADVKAVLYACPEKIADAVLEEVE